MSNEKKNTKQKNGWRYVVHVLVLSQDPAAKRKRKELAIVERGMKSWEEMFPSSYIMNWLAKPCHDNVLLAFCCEMSEAITHWFPHSLLMDTGYLTSHI